MAAKQSPPCSRMRSGKRMVFSILMNGVYTPGARRLQDRMTAALARYDG